MALSKMLHNYPWYASKFFKVNTKVDGLQRFKRYAWQVRFYDFIQSIHGPKRVVKLKPRQCGGSTETSSIFSHRFSTGPSRSGLVMADKSDRTEALRKIYSTFIQNIPEGIRPSMDKDNSERITLAGKLRNGRPGFGNEILFQTALDENAGRSEPRNWAHLSEHAFYRYALKIDDSVQNSIPLHDSTIIIKESTANGMQGIGKPFHDLYQAAKRGESLYKAFFVSWYEVEDYCIWPEKKLELTPDEKDMMKRVPQLNEGHINWYRMKLLEYSEDEDSWLSPQERIKQDFPLTDDEAFLNSGLPVFDLEVIRFYITQLSEHRPRDMKDNIGIKFHLMLLHFKSLKVFRPPRQGREYYIGADVSEGLAIGDHSSVCVIDHEYNECLSWHGKIEPDVFGHLLMEIGYLYNDAVINPENNNMGHTTVVTIRNEGYPRLYKEMIEDKSQKKHREVYGWRTTKSSKKDMLNAIAALLRERELGLQDINRVVELSQLAREENGDVVLNGKDRTVALGLAIMARKHNAPLIVGSKYRPKKYSGTGQEAHDAWEKQQKKLEKDFFD